MDSFQALCQLRVQDLFLGRAQGLERNHDILCCCLGLLLAGFALVWPDVMIMLQAESNLGTNDLAQ